MYKNAIEIFVRFLFLVCKVPISKKNDFVHLEVSKVFATVH